MQTQTQRLIGTDTFPLMGWCSVPERLSRPDVFAAIRDCGINLIMTTGAGGGSTGPTGVPEAIRRQLDLAADAGLKAIVCDRRFHPPLPGETGWRERADAALADYRGHPAAAGFYVFDEPTFEPVYKNRARVDEVALMVRHLIERAPDKVAYANALGFGCRGKECYEEYLAAFLDTIQPQFISADCYPLTTIPNAAVYPGYFADDCGREVPELNAYYRDAYWESWEIQRAQSRARSGLPLWGFVMAVPHSHAHWHYGPVTEGTIRVEAFTALAYGAQALQYFSLTTPDSPLYDHAILDPDGRPSIRYDLFRKVNRDIRLLGNALAGAVSKAVYFTDRPPSGCRRFRRGRWPGDSSHRPLATAEGDPLLLAFLEGADGTRFLLALNPHPARRARCRFALDAGWNAAEFNRNNDTWQSQTQSSWVASFEQGDAKLYRLTELPKENNS